MIIQRKEAMHMKNEITDFMELRDQFDVRLQGCGSDCTTYRRSTATEVKQLEAAGVNCHNPSDADIQAGFDMAGVLGITYCYVGTSAVKVSWF